MTLRTCRKGIWDLQMTLRTCRNEGEGAEGGDEYNRGQGGRLGSEFAGV